MTHHNASMNTSKRVQSEASPSKGLPSQRMQANTAGEQSRYAAERPHWERQFEKEPYFESGRSFDDYDSAYRIGAEGHDRHRGRQFDQIEPDLKREWEQAKGAARIGWERARQAARAAWERVEHAMPGKDDKGRH